MATKSSATITLTRLDDDVGGRNLILESDFEIESHGKIAQRYDISEEIKVNAAYVCRIWGSIESQESNFGLFLNNTEVNAGEFVKQNDGTYLLKFVNTSEPSVENGKKIAIYKSPFSIQTTSIIKKIKLEYGTVATDWSPAPEDVQAEINKVSAELKIEKDRITSTVEKTTNLENKASKLEQTAEGLLLEVSTLPKTGEDIISRINLSAESAIIESSKIDLKGYVKISDLSGKNTTIIDGSNIKTGTINASHLNVEGGRLGGWYFVGKRILSSPTLYMGAKEAGIMFIGDDNNQHIYVQDANGKVQFDVNKNGYFVANNADITGRIKATDITATNRYYINDESPSNLKKIAIDAYGGEFGGFLKIGPEFDNIFISKGDTNIHAGGINTSGYISSDIHFSVSTPKNGAWIVSGQGGVAFDLMSSGPATSTINGLARVKTPGGAWTLCSLNQDETFNLCYFNNANISSGANNINARIWCTTDGGINANALRYVRSIVIGLSSDNHRWDLNSNNDRLQLYQSTPGFAGEVMKAENDGTIIIRNYLFHNNLRPTIDNKSMCGTSNYRFTRFYAVNSSIGTSDVNEKTDISPIDERYESLFMKLRPVNFRWKNFSSEDNHDRVHGGLIAQEVEKACFECGLDSTTFAALCRDDLDEPTADGRTERYGMAYGELHGLEIHMIQKNTRMLEELISSIKKLKIRNNLI